MLALLAIVTAATLLTTNKPRCKIILSGATGVFGTMMVRDMLHRFESLDSKDLYELHLLYRDPQKLITMLSEVNAYANEYSNVHIYTHPLNFEDVEEEMLLTSDESSGKRIDFTRPLPTRLSSLMQSVNLGNTESIVLINNAGVCLPGTDLNVMQRHLLVNTIIPILLSREMLRLKETMHSIQNDNDDNNKSGKDIDMSIVNISSGDGELSFLDGELREHISGIGSDTDLCRMIQSEFNGDRDRSTTYEYAFSNGNTPLYSVSKAILNAGTRVFHQSIVDRGFQNCRVFSVCPGNIESSMTSDEERESCQPTDRAARAVLDDVFDEKEKKPSGYFYRDGEVISW